MWFLHKPELKKHKSTKNLIIFHANNSWSIGINTIINDSAYDSFTLNEKVKHMKFGKIVAPFNKNQTFVTWKA